MNGLPAWVRRTGVCSVSVVAMVAAVVSYAHMHDLAARAGEGWRAWLLPLSVDGLLVGASLVLLTRRRAGVPAGGLAWCGLALGLAVSLIANVAAAHPGVVGRLVAAWPPLALGLSYELLLSLVRPAAGEYGSGVSAVVAGDLAAEPGDPATDPGEPGEPLAAVPVPTGVDEPGRPGEPSLPERARRVVEQYRRNGRQVGRTRLARELAIPEHQARRLLQQVVTGHE